MKKKRIALFLIGFLALCAAQSLIALDRAVNARDEGAGAPADGDPA
jgi:hypothetical protein